MLYRNLAWAALVMAASFTGGCGTTVGNGAVSMSYASYSSRYSASSVSSRASRPLDVYTALTQISLCYSTVRFKSASGTSSGDIALSLGSVTLNPSGTQLATVAVPNGTYTRVEFDLDSHCTSGMSVALQTALGVSIGTASTVTIGFNGNFTVDGSTSPQPLSMNIQPLVSALEGVSAGSDIVGITQTVNGSF